jgi:hypothetical protein
MENIGLFAAVCQHSNPYPFAIYNIKNMQLFYHLNARCKYIKNDLKKYPKNAICICF